MAFVSAVVALAVFGCADEQPPVNQVGVNVVEKSIFTGSWYMSSVVIDVDFEGSAIGTYPGDAATDFNGTGFTTLPRIRWVIDEEYLYAYRDYEVISGIDGEPIDPGEHLGHPVAAWPVQSHFDIKRAYNPVTGEEQNVLTENASDRRWYERQFMRVDWSSNLLSRYYGQIHELYAMIGIYTREPTSLYVQDASEFPDSWRPQFHRMTCDGAEDTSEECLPNDKDWAHDYDKGELYSFSFVNQELLSPGVIANPFTGGPVNFCASPYSDAPEFCTAYSVYVRHSFLRVSDKRQYEPINYHEGLMDQHGYFRLSQVTYDRSTAADDPIHGATDFLNYAANRHNIWVNWHDEEGNPVPYADRQVRKTVWYSSSEMPAHLMKPSFEATSEWNVILMGMIRELQGTHGGEPPRYADMDCQTADPDAYCYCLTDSDTGDVLNPTCPGIYDPFESPDEAASRIESGEPFDCYVNRPDGAEPTGDEWNRATDEDFYGWFDAAFEGGECAMVMRTNTCNLAAVAENGGTTDGLDCQERGDIRFKLVSYVDLASTPFLGVAQLRSDPVSGEIITGDANLGGGALDNYRTNALEIYDVLNGDVSDEDIYYGEDVRAYLANLNRVDLPAPPRTDFLQAIKDAEETRALPPTLSNLNDRMDNTMVRLNQLRGPEGRRNIMSDLKQNLEGSDVERRLTENIETMFLSGVDHIPAGVNPADMSDDFLEMASPLRNDAAELMRKYEDQQLEVASRNFLVPNEYTDWGAMMYVQRRTDWPRPRVEFNLNRVLYGNAQAHELGHCMGLRHDFAGNADRQNYFEDYHIIDQQIPVPDVSEYDADGTPGLSDDEQRAYLADYEATRQRRELAGIDETMNSSIMEYTGQFYARARTRLGYYDKAAIRFGYGQLDVAEDNAAGLPLEETNTWNTPRTSFTYYHGGETCSTDADCPYSASGEMSSLLRPTNTGAGLTQRCVPSPHEGHGSVCSNFNEDIAAAAETDNRYGPVNFRYCTDDRTSRGVTPGTLGWCNLFDEGDSYREIVRNFTEAYHRSYIFSAFRRYRRNFNIGGYLFGPFFRYTGPLINIYQNMIYEYHRDEQYRTDTEPFGFYDQFLASADILNFYASILAQPNIGAYRWDSAWQRYRRSNVDPDTPGAQLRMQIGNARYFSSIYQSGLTGITRVERVGSFYDKLFILQLMSLRGFQPSYTPDVPFFVNMYDVFPMEMQQIYGGMIREDPDAYSARLHCNSGETFPVCSDAQVQYMDFYRGDCRAGSDSCRPDPVEVTYRDMPVLDGGGSILLQLYAAIYGLSEFAVYFDTTFQQQLYVCVEGQGDCFLPSDTAEEGVDYVRFDSDRYGKTFLAWQVEPTRDVANQTSIGFAMVKEAKETQFVLRALQKYRGDFGGDPFDTANLTAEELAELEAIDYDLPTDASTVSTEENRLDGRLRDLESFFNQLIQLEREIGIADILRF